MPTFANRLDTLLADTVLSAGTMRQVHLKAVRDYLESIPTDQARKEIAQIKSVQSLIVLQAAGVKADLQSIFLQTFANQNAGLGMI